MFDLILRPSAEKDFLSLDRSIQQMVIKKLEELLINPFLGKPLGNKMGSNLTGFYKLYVFKKKIRIVYQFQDKKQIYVIAIGKREKGEVYFKAFRSKEL